MKRIAVFLGSMFLGISLYGAEVKNISWSCLSMRQVGPEERKAFIVGLGGNEKASASFSILSNNWSLLCDSSSMRCISIRREAEQDGQMVLQVIGVLLYTYLAAPTATVDIRYLVLLPECQKQGIGSRALTFLKDMYLCKKMTVRPLERVQEFYRKQGFVVSEWDDDEWEKFFE